MEDGTQVSTQERVCKGVFSDFRAIATTEKPYRGVGTRHATAFGAIILVPSRPVEAKPSIPETTL
jgi:hypothetical protein